jgi:spore germination protein KC
MRYLLWEDWVKFGWLGRYKDASFDLEVDVKIRRPGLMLRTAPAMSTKGSVID